MEPCQTQMKLVRKHIYRSNFINCSTTLTSMVKTDYQHHSKYHRKAYPLQKGRYIDMDTIATRVHRRGVCTECPIIMTLRVAKAKHRKQYLFVWFLDSQKAFDKIWLDVMLWKTHMTIIHCNIYRLTSVIYRHLKSHEKYKIALLHTMNGQKGCNEVICNHHPATKCSWAFF